MRIRLGPAKLIAVASLLLLWCNFNTFAQKSDQDGPVSVGYDKLFKPGELKIEPLELKGLPPLPTGYLPLNNKAYRITTSAIVAGRHTVRFAVPSVTAEDTFQKLRIFRVDNDPFDPDGYVWLDVTLSKSSTMPPSFSTKTIYGQSEGLGTYVIAKLIREVPPNTAMADLVVITTGVTDRIRAPELINYTIKVENKGPDDASDVGLWDSVAGPVNLVSAEPSRGSCKPSSSHIVCKPGSLKAGESITVDVKLKADEGRGSFPREGREITHNAGVKALEKDPAPQNNEASDTVLVFPDVNQPPTVTLNNPRTEERFIGPADITLEATAEDVDGSIAKVEFFDSGKSLGQGTSVDGKKFVLTVRRVLYGAHQLVAVATDNGGRTDWSVPQEVFVNGLAALSVKTPTPGLLVAPGSDLTLIAVATHPSGIINKVEFFANNRSLGQASLSGPNTFSLTWRSLQRGHYSISVIAIDGSGIPTVSSPVKFIVGQRPDVVITSPIDLARFSAFSNLSIAATAKQTDGLIKRVDFYANGLLIGSASDIATETFRFTWRNVPEGQHSLKAVAVDDLGVTGVSEPIKLKVEKSSKSP